MLRALCITCAISILLLPASGQAKGFFALVTRDSKPLIDWYAAALDTRLVRTVKPPGRGITVYVLDSPDVTIEIQERSDAVILSGRPNGRVGIMKAGFAVEQLEPWLVRWRAMNAKIIAGPFDDPAPATRSAVLLDPDGNSIHITSRLSPARRPRPD